jgi:acyl-coenzyme A thioesterase PaaI-like protein
LVRPQKGSSGCAHALYTQRMSSTQVTLSDMGKNILSALPFNQHVGLSVDEVNEDFGMVTLHDRTEIHNHIGTPHAGAIFTAAEAASGAAVLGSYASMLGEVTPLALSATIDYVKVGRGSLTVEARAERSRADVLVELKTAEKGVTVPVSVSVKDATGLEVSRMKITWYLKKNREAQPAR